MSQIAAYAAPSAKAPLGPHTITRRDPGPHDVQIDIAPWTVRETADFIRLAIHRAGGHAPLFTVEAIQAIHDSTQGVPAKIISLGNLCLLAATGAEEEFVTSEIAEAAAGELFPRIDHSTSKSGVHSNRSAETRFARSAMR